MLKILGRIGSINVRKVVWSCEELALAFEREDWGLPIRDPHEPGFLALNPNAQVPVLIDGDFVLWESSAIMRYLAERGDGALIPSDRQQRALMEQWLSWQATELAPSWVYAFLALGRPTPGYDDPHQIAASIGKWSPKMAMLEAQLGRAGPFVGGERFTLADIALGVSLHRWFGTPFDKPSMPEVERYYQLLRRRPAATTALDPRTP
jgi:glutathione S-transferase